MHPALQLSNVNRLPFSIRRAANLACSPNCSPADVRRVCLYLATITVEQEVYALPVFFYNLDPTGIPTSDNDIETLSPGTMATIDRAMIALQALYTTRFPNAVGVDLWPRIWLWVRFVSLHPDLPLIPAVTERELCVDLVVFAATLTDHLATTVLIKSTPGFWFMLGKAWAGIVELPNAPKRTIGLSALHNFIKEPEVAEPHNLADIIGGAGGTLQDLSRLVIRFINTLLPSSTATMDVMNMRLLGGVLRFIHTLEPLLDIMEGADLPLGPLGLALASQDIVPSLTRAACAVSERAIEMLPNILFILGKVLIHTATYAGVPQAIENDILRALVFGAQDPPSFPSVQLFVCAVLPQFFIYRSVIAVLGPALDRVAPLVATAAFQQSEIYPEWENAMAAARERLDILRSATAAPALRACDNIECLAIRAKSSFKRCSGCWVFYYCSSRCQKVDWGKGGHREVCAAYGTLCFSEASDDLTTRDRAFFRAIMQHDYQKSKPRILPKELSFRHLYPTEEYLVLYDYTEGAVKITPQRLNSEATHKLLNGPEWMDIVSRVAQSGGRMRLHVMVHLEAVSQRYWAICLRTDTSRIDDFLRQMAMELPKDRQKWDTEEMSAAFASLITDSQNFVEIH
ncbi:hypothetical protein C8R47DRAFT_1223434 [Mycena vitilis]|nr:hypothetical protein C8R47DRAFT_1223434 [Mycena vitilis]